MKIAAIVAARTGSSRLPGKVLEDICGEPMLWHIVERLKLSKLINQVIVATSVNPKDNAIEDLCRSNSIDFYRGSEEDVLGRYYQAACAYGAGAIVRVTGDCPFIDPRIVDKVITAYLGRKDVLDGASNIIKRTFPRGLDTEVISFPALETCFREGVLPEEREHLTLYIYRHPERFKLYSVTQKDCLGSLRWTVDEEDDLKFTREVYKRLYPERKLFLMRDILALLAAFPGLGRINECVRQKNLL